MNWQSGTTMHINSLDKACFKEALFAVGRAERSITISRRHYPHYPNGNVSLKYC